MMVVQAVKVTGLLEGLPLSFLGHSAGSGVACETAWQLKRLWGYTPQRIINVALVAPDVSGTDQVSSSPCSGREAPMEVTAGPHQ